MTRWVSLQWVNKQLFGPLLNFFENTMSKIINGIYNFFTQVLWNKIFLFVCWGLTKVSTCKPWYFGQCAATQGCHAADTRHYTPPRHSIQTQGRPVVVLSIDVERHTGIHFNVLEQTPTRKSFPNLPHIPAIAQLYDAVMVVVSQKLGRKCTVPTGSCCHKNYLSPRMKSNAKIAFMIS